MAYQGHVSARDPGLRQRERTYQGDFSRQERLSKGMGDAAVDFGESVKSYAANKREQTKLHMYDQKRRLDTAVAGHKLSLSEAERKAYTTHGSHAAAMKAYQTE